jgi:beta-lactamase regulating signal transducer with metallopeptidase domain
MLANHAIAWAITYLLHSTLLLSLAWLASRRLARWSVRAEEVVWRVALVGGLLTASLQMAAGWEPLAGRVSLPETAAASVSAPTLSPAPPMKRAASERNAFPMAPAAPSGIASEAAAPGKAPLSLPALALGFWALGALLLTIRCVASVLRLRRRIENRPRVVGGTLFAQLSRLTAEAGFTRPVRLTCSSRLPVPVALGLGQSEVCVPPRALVGLSPEEQEGLLAHELAHLARRDSFWLVFGQILASVLFFQPLNLVARRRLREISEILSDEWAIGRTGRPLSLARCLAEVAGWSVGTVRLPVPGMADRPSNLGHRIRRLLDDARSPERSVRPVWLGAALLILLVAVAAAAPGVSAAVKKDVQKPAEPAEMAQAEDAAEPEEWEIAEEDDQDSQEAAEEAEHEAERDAEEDYATDLDLDIDTDLDLDFDFDFDIESELGELAALEGLHEELADLAEGETLSPEERQRLESDLEKMNTEVEKITEEVERSLRPQIERMQQEIERSLQPEMDRLQEEMERSKPQMERLQREIEESMRPEMERLEKELEQLEKNGRRLSEEERDRIEEQARRLSEDASRRANESEEFQKALQEAQRESHEVTRRVMAEHKAEMDAMRQQIEQQVRPLREQMERRIEETYRRDVKVHREKIQKDKEERERQKELRRQRASEHPSGR